MAVYVAASGAPLGGIGVCVYSERMRVAYETVRQTLPDSFTYSFLHQAKDFDCAVREYLVTSRRRHRNRQTGPVVKLPDHT
jgi:hypothetical protein